MPVMGIDLFSFRLRIIITSAPNKELCKVELDESIYEWTIRKKPTDNLL
ncbi:MAG: hypothetical protein ACJA0U_002333 [Salibacteraceae bacterium]|jgi:hypothetical protein